MFPPHQIDESHFRREGRKNITTMLSHYPNLRFRHSLIPIQNTASRKRSIVDGQPQSGAKTDLVKFCGCVWHCESGLWCTASSTMDEILVPVAGPVEFGANPSFCNENMVLLDCQYVVGMNPRVGMKVVQSNT